jgi:DNA-binding Xre family transcriptional regulator
VASIRASKEGLQKVNQARNKKRWTKYSCLWAEEAGGISPTTLKRFWRRDAIRPENFINICQAVGVNWEEIVDDSFDGASEQTVGKWLFEVKAVIQKEEEILMNQLFQTVNKLSGYKSVKTETIDPGFDPVWQPVDLVMPPSRARSRASESSKDPDKFERAKLIDLGQNQVVALVVKFTPEPDDGFGVAIEVYPGGDAIYLPEGLLVSVVEESGEIISELQRRAESASDLIELEFGLAAEALFGIRLDLGNDSIIEMF